MKKAILLFLVAGVALSGCKKDDSNGSGGGSANATILTTGKWKITSAVSVISYGAPIGDQTVDTHSLISACQQDNLYIFNANNTGTLDEGATKCNASDAQQRPNGTWSLSGSQLIAGDGTTNITSDILTLNSSSMTLRYYTNYGGYPAVTTTQYVNVP